MSKMTLTVDTTEKTMALTSNGIEVKDVSDASAYVYRNEEGEIEGIEFSFSVRQFVDGVTNRISYTSYAKEKAESFATAGVKTYDDVEGFIGIDNNQKAFADMCKYFSFK